MIQFSFIPQSDLKFGQLVFSLIYPDYTYNYTDTIAVVLDPSLDPTITSISLQSASPILKQNMVITGSSFDIDPENMRAYLYFAGNDTKKYELGILSVANSSAMAVVLGGGRTGNYNVRV